VDDQRRRRDGDEEEPDVGPQLRPPDVDEDKEDHRRRKVHGGVVAIEQPDEVRVAERGPLHRQLGVDAEPILQSEHLVGVVEGAARLVPTQHAPEAVQEQERDDDSDLLDQPGPVSASPPAGNRRGNAPWRRERGRLLLRTTAPSERWETVRSRAADAVPVVVRGQMGRHPSRPRSIAAMGTVIGRL
jgi:hypothetical protein